MEKIRLGDIDFREFKRIGKHGTQGMLYTNGDFCVKMLHNLSTDEKYKLQRKTLEMDGISINGVVFPDGLVYEGDNLVALKMDYFANSKSFFEHFTGSRYVDSQAMFNAFKEASLILRDIHSANIVCQDLNPDNILIDKNGTVKYCDIDSCLYNGYGSSQVISLLLKNYIYDYRRYRNYCLSENSDRLSLMLSFYLLTYLKEIQQVSKKEYNSLANGLNTLKNSREYAKMLVNKELDIPEIPYMDALIDASDNGYIDRKNNSLTRIRLK